ncbi:MAG: hypothetical protein GY878_20685 [Fuerstiella sp.]|nr:hypothetical protein [Fuerstiella sp.]
MNRSPREHQYDEFVSLLAGPASSLGSRYYVIGVITPAIGWCSMKM